MYLIIMLASFGVCAQMTNSGATMTVIESTRMAIDADFTNEGILINEGAIYLYRDWNNLGTYTDENGELLLASDEDQVINKNSQQINDIQVTGGGRKILTEDLEIGGEINFTEGRLVTADSARLILLAGATIVGADENNYIIGELYRKGTGDLYFPIGSESEFLPATLFGVSGVDPIVGMEAFSEAPSQAVGIGEAELLTDHYWKLIKDANYTSSRIGLPIDYFNISGEAVVLVAQSQDSSASFTAIGGLRNERDNLIISQGLAVGEYFTVVLSEEVVLPPIKVINVVTPQIDGRHDFLRIENIELYENNVVEIFSRTGEKVFSMSNYNNQDRVFLGASNAGSSRQLETGTYYYTIRAGRNRLGVGFIFLKR